MEVACYAQHQQQHSEFQQRGGIPAYELQSSPGSVDSITSTDAGPVQAIQNFHLQQQQQFSEHEFHKLSGAGKSLQFCGDYHQQQQQQKECGGRQASYMQQSVNRNRDYLTPAAVSDSYSALHGDSQSESATQHRLNVTIPTEQTSAATTLTTPDVVNMLRAGDFATTSSSVTSHSSEPSFYVGEKHVTQEQEMYAQGFVRELERLKSGAVGDDKPGLITSIAHHHYEPSSYFDHQPSSSGTVHHMAAMHHPLGHLSPHSAMLARLKEEPPQTVPMLAKSPPVSPIDMDHQEVIKSERKRLRNRIAASKCRKRKLERISRLEDKVAALKSQNHELSSSANLLRQQVAELKSKVMAHVNSGCQLMLTQHQVTF